MREADIVAGDVKSTEREELEAPLLLDESCSRILLSGLEDWSVQSHAQNRLNDSESEELLNAIDPNELCRPVLSESESEDQSSDEQRSQSAVYQLVYDISGGGGAMAEAEPPHVDVISIDLDEWGSQMLLSDSCVVNELVSCVRTDVQDTHTPDGFLVYPELQLTDEEQKLLDQEGVSLPNNLPLTKAEERILKKVRRKIRNKLSAQDSRRRKKEYIDGLESRVASCSAQNKELQRTVDQLEKHNTSLVAQLHRLQTLIKQTATKAAQTSTCIMILLFSLALLIFPSYSPFSRRSQEVEDSYAPSAVVSRNILTAVGSSALQEAAVEDESVLTEPASVPPELRARAEPPDLTREPISNLTTGPEGDAVELTAPAQNTNTHTNINADAAKAPHADEM